MRAEGHRVVYVGDCWRNPLDAAAADVAVFPAPDPSWKEDPSGVWLLEPDYAKLVELRNISIAMREEARSFRNLILVPNVACIAGALLLGLSSLAVVVLSNPGTLTVYSHGRDALSRTERRLQAPPPAPSCRGRDERPRRQVSKPRRAGGIPVATKFTGNPTGR